MEREPENKMECVRPPHFCESWSGVDIYTWTYRTCKRTCYCHWMVPHIALKGAFHLSVKMTVIWPKQQAKHLPMTSLTSDCGQRNNLNLYNDVAECWIVWLSLFHFTAASV